MSLIYVLLPLFAFANVNSSDVIAMHSPRGVRIVTVSDLADAQSPNELLQKLLPHDQAFEYRRSFAHLSRPVTEQNLSYEFRAQADEAVARFVRLLVGLMRQRSLTIDLAGGTPVSYEASATHIPSRTTPGLIDACWECYGGAGNREYVAHGLGLDVGSLKGKVSFNPRFTRQLFRGSAALYKITINTLERGPVRVGLRLELDESYHPFVADVPVARERFGQRVYGTSQRLRILAEAELDPVVFGLAHVDWIELDQFSLISDTLPKRPSRGFADVADRAVPDQARQGFVPRMVRDLTENVRGLGMMTKSAIELPGSPSWFE